MSTKIYYGYKLAEIKTFKDLDKFRQDLTIKAQEEQKKIATKLAVHSGVFMLDLYQTGFDVPDEKETIFGYGYHKVRERIRKFNNESYKDPEYDLRAEIVVFLRDSTLAIFIGDNKDLRRIFEEYPGVTYYGYWNNTDPPEDVSEEEWRIRERDWEFLEGPLCDHGLIISPSGYDYPRFLVDQNEFSKSFIPDWNTRLKHASTNIICLKIDNQKIEIPNLPTDVMQKANMIYNWVERGDGRALVKQEMEELKLILNKDLNHSDIFNKRFNSFEIKSRI